MTDKPTQKKPAQKKPARKAAPQKRVRKAPAKRPSPAPADRVLFGRIADFVEALVNDQVWIDKIGAAVANVITTTDVRVGNGPTVLDSDAPSRISLEESNWFGPTSDTLVLVDMSGSMFALQPQVRDIVTRLDGETIACWDDKLTLMWPSAMKTTPFPATRGGSPNKRIRAFLQRHHQAVPTRTIFFITDRDNISHSRRSGDSGGQVGDGNVWVNDPFTLDELKSLNVTPIILCGSVSAETAAEWATRHVVGRLDYSSPTRPRR